MINVNGIGGVGEKVTIDGQLVTEKMELTTYSEENPLGVFDTPIKIPANTLIDEELEIINEAPTVTVDGTTVAENTDLESVRVNLRCVDLPEKAGGHRMIVYRNEVHVLGGSTNTYNKLHYKLTGDGWVEVSTLPYNYFQYGCAAVMNDELHIMGAGEDATDGYHYKWDGSAWTKISTNITALKRGCAVTLNNEIYRIGGGESSSSISRANMYKFDGSAWTTIGKIAGNTSAGTTYAIYNGAATVWNGEIHIFGCKSTISEDDNTGHWKWDGTSWGEVSAIPFSFVGGEAVALDDGIHIVVGEYHYKWNGTEWIDEGLTPFNVNHCGACEWDGRIKITGGNEEASALSSGIYGKRHFNLNESLYRKVENQ